MSESQPEQSELPVEPVRVTEGQAVKRAQPARSNTGVIIVGMGVVVLVLVIVYFVIFDKTKNGTAKMNTYKPVPVYNRNIGNQLPLNTQSISSNSGYGYKANAY